jgi:hypothetical protein
VGLQLVEVGVVVEVGVEHGAVVLAGRDQYGRLAAEGEIVTVLGVECDRL